MRKNDNLKDGLYIVSHLALAAALYLLTAVLMFLSEVCFVLGDAASVIEKTIRFIGNLTVRFCRISFILSKRWLKAFAEVMLNVIKMSLVTAPYWFRLIRERFWDRYTALCEAVVRAVRFRKEVLSECR